MNKKIGNINCVPILKYEFLPHLADARFRAYGQTLEEVLANAALAMVSLMWEAEKIRPTRKEVIKVEASSLEQLTVKFLTEFLYLLDVKSFLLAEVESIKVEETQKDGRKLYRLEAEVAGDSASPEYEIYGLVKAVTYNEMKIEKTDGLWVLEVVVDM
ncbi:MAG TPA: archease [Candidatus Saccharicenans sp.]|nr:archease [Candidatus Saccharicenans sp.]HUM78583.1 archease [Candidatus Saccharicenans sp.]